MLMLHHCGKNKAKSRRFSAKVEGYKLTPHFFVSLIHFLGFVENIIFIEQAFQMQNSLVKDATVVEQLKTYFNQFFPKFQLRKTDLHQIIQSTFSIKINKKDLCLGFERNCFKSRIKIINARKCNEYRHKQQLDLVAQPFDN